MSKVRFIGSDDPTEDETCTVFGLTFPKGEAVTVPADVFAKLSNNPTFAAVKSRGAASE